MKFSFHPKLIDCLPGYDRARFGRDLSAGIVVGVLALPLSIAFAIASGATPTAGVWTAIVAGFLTSLLGGSRVQIGGPTGAFIPIIYGIVAAYGFGNLLIATLLSGFLLLLMGAFRLGQLIRFIPVSVVIGFTNGIAVVLLLSQLKDFLGLPIADLPADFFPKLKMLAAHADQIHLPTLLLASTSLIFLFAYGRLTKRVVWLAKVPGPILLLVLATAATALFSLPVDTIGSRFGGIPQELPTFAWPTFSLDALHGLVGPAITIALLGAIESLLSARVADNVIGDRHDPNQELMAQGIANIASPLFGGIPATGALARTAANTRFGGRTPVAGMAAAVALLAIVLLFAPLAANVPIAALSAIVVLVACNMGEWREFTRMRRFSKAYRSILVTTFLVTLVFDLTVAVELGMALACLFFILKISRLTQVERCPLPPAAARFSERLALWRLYGSLFFGAADKLETLLEPASGTPDVLILDMEHLVQMDTTGQESLAHLREKLAERGCLLIVFAVHAQPGSLMYRSGFMDALGEMNRCATLDAALSRAEDVLARLN
ncbi:MAG: STAS domain-containing protein [Zoogloeaceae bacterium]|jgi:SulP family sulfate permease|nr:STAS domain-containing protein [Zoogloeaceae bacterium]